ncbi:hypothetical protein [Subtercola frigoramans]|uniref:Protein involved in plasmid replication-relaxation n=1 Tax=Subtercola frigoramans TaxID=120298 RepID=A0ABS2L0D5_9MICO|nr:hypothetical protein [Subtercola frigoramans]MBM7470528.1 hypothetical protein [Subtercola frigoramans]
MTERDEAMLEWLTVVRIADIEGVRWALGATSGRDQPVTIRRANQWVTRLAKLGWVDRARPTFRDGSIIWATHQAIGKTPPNLFKQTTRHEVAVALVSARYLAAGYAWRRDRKPAGMLDHQVDGVAQKGDRVELVEVELTPKTWQRYKQICDNHVFRLDRENVARVAYFCTADAARIVDREADKFIFRTERHKLTAVTAFDVKGHWIAGDAPVAETVVTAGPESVSSVLQGAAGWGAPGQVEP